MSETRFPPRPAVAVMRPYVPGKPIAEVQRELGLTDVIKLASNENPLGPSPRALAAAVAALPGSHVYPEGSSAELRAVLAQRWELPPQWIFVGNGSDEVFRLLAEVYLEPGDRVVMPTPSFAGYRLVAELMGAEIVAVPLAGSTMDLVAMAAAAQGGGGGGGGGGGDGGVGGGGVDTRPAKLVFLCRPNNPTGGVFAEDDFERFMADVPAGTLVVVDEAYREFDDSPFRSRRYLCTYPNLIVARTFSKIYGLAGLRIGYGVAGPEVWAPLYTARDPFSVNLVAQAAAAAALDDDEHVQRSLALNAAGKATFTQLCAELGLQATPTAANFMLIDLGRPAAPVDQALLRLGVIVRPCASFGLPACIRVTMGTAAENDRFARALRQVLAP